MSRRLIDLADIDLLMRIERSGSIAGAARTLGLTQPAASARVRALEGRTALRLVQRSARGSSLTDDGEAVRSWGLAVMASLAVLDAGVAALQGRAEAQLHVAASLTIAEHLVPAWFAELKQRLPSVQAGLNVVNSTNVVRLVESGDADIGFTETRKIPADLFGQQVGVDHLVIVVHPAHAWARRTTPVTRDELARTPLIVREPGSGTRHTLDVALGCDPVVHMEMGSTAALLAAARAGAAPGVVSRMAAATLAQQGELTIVPATLDFERPLRAVWRGPTPPGPARDLLAVVMDVGRGQGPRDG